MIDNWSEPKSALKKKKNSEKKEKVIWGRKWGWSEE